MTDNLKIGTELHRLMEENTKLTNENSKLREGIKQMLDAFEYNGTRLLGAEYHAKENLKKVMGYK